MNTVLKPMLSFYELEYYLDRFQERLVENTRVYRLIRKLTNQAHFTYEDKFDKRWMHFYLPVRRHGRKIAVPFSVIEYQKEFFISIHSLGNIRIKKGKKEIEDMYEKIPKEALRFIPYIKADETLLKRMIPYDIRTGRIKGKYILEKTLSEIERKRISGLYERHLRKNHRIGEVTLNEYLNVAGICYKAAFSRKTRDLSSREMYGRWADGRDGGMLSIKDWDSSREFMEWLESGVYAGAHPFEIVFSWHRHGIHLYPPSLRSTVYRLMVTNYVYAPEYIRMVKALVKKEVEFKAMGLMDVLDYLTGETYFTVNDYSEHYINYIPSKEDKKLFFHHIEWDEIKTPEWSVKTHNKHLGASGGFRCKAIWIVYLYPPYLEGFIHPPQRNTKLRHVSQIHRAIGTTGG